MPSWGGVGGPPLRDHLWQGRPLPVTHLLFREPGLAHRRSPRDRLNYQVEEIPGSRSACAASFYAHVFFDKEYHVEGSRLQQFAWFRRKQELHFVHHRHANSNFAVIHFFWDRILGTYRRPDAGQSQMDGTFGPASERRQGCVRFGTSLPKLTPARRLYAGEGIERPDPSAQLCDSAHPWKSHVQKVRAGFSWEDRSIA
jgi:hypothetical protein